MKRIIVLVYLVVLFSLTGLAKAAVVEIQFPEVVAEVDSSLSTRYYNISSQELAQFTRIENVQLRMKGYARSIGYFLNSNNELQEYSSFITMYVQLDEGGRGFHLRDAFDVSGDFNLISSNTSWEWLCDGQSLMTITFKPNYTDGAEMMLDEFTFIVTGEVPEPVSIVLFMAGGAIVVKKYSRIKFTL